jgi:hypothetical protein
MYRECLRWLFAVLLTASVCAEPVLAQTRPASGQSRTSNRTKQQLQTIVFAGLAGAILGLSTLSFYGRPQDKLSNIAVGFAFGIITGTVVATYQAAVSSKEYRANVSDSETWQRLANSMTPVDRRARPVWNLQTTF